MQSRTCVIRASGDETDHLFQIERRCLQPRRRPTSSYLCPSHHTSVKKSSQRRLILPQISSTCVLAYVLCPLPLSLSALIPRLAVHLQFLLLTTPHLSNIGVSISPLAALLNHSCTPNAVVVFPSRPTPSSPRFMRIIAISPIKEGDEVLTSYVDLGLTRRARRKELEERYGFECDCKLCELGKGVELSGKGWVDPRESLECKDEKCGGVLAMPGSCPS